MRRYKLTVALVLVIALLTTPTVVFASGEQGFATAQDCLPPLGEEDSVRFGSDCTLQSGQSIPGSLVVFGGNVVVEADAVIHEDLIVFGGNVSMDGLLDGDVFILGGSIDLGPNAVVEGNVTSPGGNITQDPAAQIHGNRVSEVGPFSDGVSWDWGSWTLGSVVWSVFQALAMSAVAVLVALFAPEHLRRTAGAIVRRPLESGGLGILTFLLLVILIPVSIITCVGPIILIFLLVAALALGWVALGYELGKRMAAAFNQEWTIVLQAWVGTLTLGVIASFIGIVPCIGWLIEALLGAVGLGAVLLTRFGTLGEPVAAATTKSAPRTTTRRTAKK